MTDQEPNQLGRIIEHCKLPAGFLAFIGSVFVAEFAINEFAFWWTAHTSSSASNAWQACVFYQYAMIPWLICHGMFLAYYLNPVTDESYRNWLTQTPWTAKRNLPFNQVKIGLADWLVIGLAVSLWTLPYSRILLLLAFFVPYCYYLTRCNYRCEEYASVYAAVWSASLLAFTYTIPWLAALTVISIYAFCLWGYRQSLLGFPWTTIFHRQNDASHKSPTHPAWPLVNKSGLNSIEPLIDWKHVFGISLTGGWLAGLATYLLCFRMGVVALPELAGTCVGSAIICFAACVASVRSLRYYTARESPLGLFARIGTGRLLIFKYDVALLAPLTVVGIGLAFGVLTMFGFSPLPLPFVSSVSSSLILAAGLGMGPSMPEWEFTGEYRTSLHQASVNEKWLEI